MALSVRAIAAKYSPICDRFADFDPPNTKSFWCADGLEELGDVLHLHPEIHKVTVLGHTDAGPKDRMLLIDQEFSRASLSS